LTDRDLVAMVTTNPGDALSRCWGKTIGRLMTGAFADVCVIKATGSKSVWTQIVESTEGDVLLVVSRGVPRYGEPGLMTAAGAVKPRPLTVGSLKRRFSMPDPEDSSKTWTWRDITSRIAAVRKDPKAALKKSEGLRRAYAGARDAPAAPLELVLDMPSGGLPMAGNLSAHAADIVIPPLVSLEHDAKFFSAIKHGGFHDKRLDGLAGFYS
jgi:5-methylthioadenosine/S-adenosylhomocysteine deaminase